MAIGRALPEATDRIQLADGRWLELLEPLGRGSSATVHRGVLGSRAFGFETVERQVAVKLFSPVSSEEADVAAAALVRAVRRLALVEHPNVARVYECGLWRAQPFVVSELVAGVSLAAFLDGYARRQRRPPLDLALFVGVEVAEALAGARVASGPDGVQLAMLHHGLSSREVLLSVRGEVKVTDFEVSTVRAASSSVCSMRAVARRAASLAPEVAQGDEPDPRSDVFSLGLLLRELLIGPRFPASLTSTEALRLAREGFVQSFTFQPHLPDGLVSVIARALEVEPDRRYPNAGAMAFDLRREALAMGVGDGRYFLRCALERDWAPPADEITSERSLGPAAGPRPSEEEREVARARRRDREPHGAEVTPLKRRR